MFFLFLLCLAVSCKKEKILHRNKIRLRVFLGVGVCICMVALLKKINSLVLEQNYNNDLKKTEILHDQQMFKASQIQELYDFNDMKSNERIKITNIQKKELDLIKHQHDLVINFKKCVVEFNISQVQARDLIKLQQSCEFEEMILRLKLEKKWINSNIPRQIAIIGKKIENPVQICAPFYETINAITSAFDSENITEFYIAMFYLSQEKYKQQFKDYITFRIKLSLPDVNEELIKGKIKLFYELIECFKNSFKYQIWPIFIKNKQDKLLEFLDEFESFQVCEEKNIEESVWENGKYVKKTNKRQCMVNKKIPIIELSQLSSFLYIDFSYENLREFYEYIEKNPNEADKQKSKFLLEIKDSSLRVAYYRRGQDEYLKLLKALIGEKLANLEIDKIKLVASINQGMRKNLNFKEKVELEFVLDKFKLDAINWKNMKYIMYYVSYLIIGKANYDHNPLYSGFHHIFTGSQFTNSNYLKCFQVQELFDQKVSISVVFDKDKFVKFDPDYVLENMKEHPLYHLCTKDNFTHKIVPWHQNYYFWHFENILKHILNLM